MSLSSNTKIDRYEEYSLKANENYPRFLSGKPHLADDIRHIVLFVVYAALLLYFCSKNSPFFLYQTGSDVNLYMDVGRAVGKGAVLYRDVFEQKGPTLLLLYSLLAKLTPGTMTGLYLFQSLTLGISLFYLYKTARLFLSKKICLWICLIFPFFILNYQVYQAGGGSPEELILPCYMGGMYFLIRFFLSINGTDTGKAERRTSGSFVQRFFVPGFFVQGFFAGIVLLVKINLTGFFLVGCGMVFLYLLLQRQWRMFFKAALWFAAGIFAAVLPCILYMAATQSFHDFWSVYIKFNSLYASPALNYENQSFPAAVVNAAFLNLPAAICAGYGFFAIRTKVIRFSKYGEISYILTCAGLVTMTYIAGRAYHYYSIPILCFTGIGMIGFVLLWQKYWRSSIPVPTKHSIHPLAVTGIIAGIIVFTILCNVQFFDSPYINPEKTGVEQISETLLSTWKQKGGKEDPNILLYDTGDLGFYELTGTYPKVRIFHMLHINVTAYPDLINTQKDYISKGIPDYVICSGYDEPLPSDISDLNPQYQLIDQQEQRISGQTYSMTLYQKQDRLVP